MIYNLYKGEMSGFPSPIKLISQQLEFYIPILITNPDAMMPM